MQVKQLGKRRWVLVAGRGEELVGAVTEFLTERDIRGGWLTGIGAVTNHTLGYYDVTSREYLRRTFDEVMELGSLIGTVGWLDGKPVLHAHATVSGPELIAFTGHLFRAEVAVTVEMVLLDFQTELERRTDEEVGLPLFLVDRGGAPQSRRKDEAEG